MAEELLSPEQCLTIIERQQADVARRVDVNSGLLYALWGLAWLIGFGLYWLEATGRLTVDKAVLDVVFFVLLAGAGVTTSVVTTRAVSGIGGPGSLAGAYYGLSWIFGLGAFSLLMGAFTRAGADAELMSLLSSSIAVLVVGLLYCAGAAIWRSQAQFRLGAWILVVVVVAAWLGLPEHYLVLSLAGGGGLLAAAGLSSLNGRA